MKRLWSATLSSIDGLSWAWRHERAFQQEIGILAAAVPLSFFVAGDAWTRTALIASILFVILVEILNTAIEKLSDHVTPEQNATIKVVKDLGSAAVMLAIVIAGMFWAAALAALVV